MKKLSLLLVLLLNTFLLFSQNLVLNPSFDVFITCPGFGQFSNTYIANWNKPSIASSDYYNYNCPGIHPAVQAPHSGEGYAGIIAYNFGTEYREYVTGTFSSPLVAGKTYEVEFYVSLHNGYIQAITELGAYISVAAPGPFANVLHINVTPHIENQLTPLADTSLWMKVSGSFVASGGEQFITIGNFNDDAGTTIIQPGSSGSFGAYYFIDDVAVLLDSTTSIPSIADSQLQIWYSDGLLQFNAEQLPVSRFPLQLTGYNSLGQKIVDCKINSPFVSIPMQLRTGGIYYFAVSKNGKIITGQKTFINQ